MAIYRQVHTSFWQDPEMIEYEPEEKYFYIYLMTNPHTTQCGIYEVSPRLLSVELGYSMDTVWELLNKFIDRGKILYSKDTREVFILNWLKYNSLKSPKVMQCVEKELKEVKNVEFIKAFYDLCIQYEYPIDTLSIDLGEEQEQQQEEEKEVEEEQEQKEEEEKKVDIEQEQQGKENSSCSIPQKSIDDFKDENIKIIYKEFEQNGFGTLTITIKEMLVDLIDEYSLEWVREAIRIAVKANRRTLNYVEGILNNWRAQGGMKMESNTRNKTPPKRNNNKFHNAEQRTDKYSAEELEEIARRKREAYYAKTKNDG